MYRLPHQTHADQRNNVQSRPQYEYSWIQNVRQTQEQKSVSSDFLYGVRTSSTSYPNGYARHFLRTYTSHFRCTSLY